ncbi:MAG: KH domain-containing protein [Candidatus Marsarchaeota archaeon]|nr:KH domain-containing protein [Candidatus Marsarchaeota archaeon]
MQEVYINAQRIKRMREMPEIVSTIEKRTKSKIEISPTKDFVTIESNDAVMEFSAANIITAFGRGFDVQIALLLLSDDYYFSYIDLRQIFGNSSRLQQIKSRVIGENGRTKLYIESVSGAHLSIYGHTIGFIGMIEQINEAETAVRTLVEGGSHKLAYQRMEASHRKHKDYTHIFK